LARGRPARLPATHSTITHSIADTAHTLPPSLHSHSPPRPFHLTMLQMTKASEVAPASL